MTCHTALDKLFNIIQFKFVQTQYIIITNRLHAHTKFVYVFKTIVKVDLRMQCKPVRIIYNVFGVLCKGA